MKTNHVTDVESLFDGLNPQQKEALLYTDGALLVLAGAGSGKTSVIVHKFSYLVKSKKLSPDSILTITFTNKAADEMKERISALLQRDATASWIGTFHSKCSSILRKEIKVLGYKNNFSIYDEADQCNLLKHILKEFGMHEVLYKGVASKISSLKAALIGPEEFLSMGDSFGFDEKLARIYMRYQDELKRSNALDFDDLIMLTVKLFEENPQILEKYQDMFRYILVDEFQDTNYAQYRLIKLLASATQKICVVGDDDQSIYKFRGANVNNILDFEDDFPGVKLIRLEQNYRSTQNILAVSGAIISKNPSRKCKNLWTEREDGEKVYLCWFSTHEEEAKHVAKVIKELYLKGKYNYKDFAIFYRINLQSKAIEDALREEGIPYRVLGNISFYQRKEIKDLIAYLRLSLNNDDNVSLRRIINCPPRGIGIETLSKIEQEAKKKSISLFEAIKLTLSDDSFAFSVKEKLANFVRLIDDFSSSKYTSASEMLRSILEKSGYAETISEEKAKNIEELISSAEGKRINEFLDKVSVFTNMDGITEGEFVSLMTLHSAKGLEFPVVFITGVEEGLLPYYKARDSDEVSEERRLLYVGMTRAKDLLWLTGAQKRKLYVKLQDQKPSRFLEDIPEGYCHYIGKVTTYEEKKEEVSPCTAYAVGCRVKHPAWGIGVVRDCYGEGDEQKVTVNFPEVGLKRLSAKFANLERV